MSDLSTAHTLKLQNIKLDLQTKCYNDDRFTHEKITDLPVLNYYFTNNKSPRKLASESGRFDSNDNLVQVFKQRSRDEGTYWGKTADAFWGTVETRVTYHKTTTGRRIRNEREYALHIHYELDLENEIRSAIEKVNAKYQKRFVKHIDDQIQNADPFYAWVKNGEVK
jgi:hypothetical protein